MDLNEVNKKLQFFNQTLDNKIMEMEFSGTGINAATLKSILGSLQTSILGNAAFQAWFENADPNTQKQVIANIEAAAKKANEALKTNILDNSAYSSVHSDIQDAINTSNKQVFNVSKSMNNIETEGFDIGTREKEVEKSLKNIDTALAMDEKVSKTGKTPAELIAEINSIKKSKDDFSKQISNINEVKTINFKKEVEDLKAKLDDGVLSIDSAEIQADISLIKKHSVILENVYNIGLPDRIKDPTNPSVSIPNPYKMNLKGKFPADSKSDTDVKDWIEKLIGDKNATPPTLGLVDNAEFKKILDPENDRDEFDILLEGKENEAKNAYERDIDGKSGLKLLLTPEELNDLKAGTLNIEDKKKELKTYQKVKGSFTKSQLEAFKKSLEPKLEAYKVANRSKNDINIDGTTYSFGEEMLDSNVNDEKYAEYIESIYKNPDGTPKPDTDPSRKNFDEKVKALIGRPRPTDGRRARMAKWIRDHIPFLFKNYESPEEKYDNEMFEKGKEVLKTAIDTNKQEHDDADLTVFNEKALFRQEMGKQILNNKDRVMNRKDTSKQRNEMDYNVR